MALTNNRKEVVMFKGIFITTGLIITAIYQAQDVIREIVRGFLAG